MESTKPAVSIGMPVYNGEKHIREALDSLLAQTFSDFELIISDNASTDGTGAICQEYAARDRRIRYVRQSRNLGSMANFRYVLNEATAGYFMWAAADDRWDAGWLAALMKQLSPGVAVAFGSGVDFWDDGRRRPFTLIPIAGSRTVRMLRCYLWSEWGTKSHVFYGLYRTGELRKIAADVIGQCTDYRHCLDNLVVFKVFEFGSLRLDPAVTFYKRHRPDEVRSARPLKWYLLHPAAVVLRLDYVPYLLEHIRRSPPGLARCVILAATPLKYMCVVGGGAGPAFAAACKRIFGALTRRHPADANG